MICSLNIRKTAVVLSGMLWKERDLMNPFFRATTLSGLRTRMERNGTFTFANIFRQKTPRLWNRTDTRLRYDWKKTGKHQWYSGRKETTIWEFDKPKKNGDHPTMKPIPLLAYPIMNSSMTNTLVLDPFGGSGSTLIACEQADRSCATIELDEKYCDVIVKRYIEQVGSADKVSVQRDGLTYAYVEVTAHEDSNP